MKLHTCFPEWKPVFHFFGVSTIHARNGRLDATPNLLPDRELATPGRFEMKTTATGKVENFARNFPAEPGGFDADFCEIGSIKHNQRSTVRDTAGLFGG